MSSLVRAAALAGLSVLAAAPVAGQGSTPARGTVVQRVVSTADPAQSYALYLPARWEPGRRWPLLVLMDPGGQATVPMERFRAAAERNGWIVASSWNTAAESDSALALDDRAVNAILADALERYAADTTRLYFAGFSGTARYAWALPQRLNHGRVAGIIGVGAGLPRAPGAWLPQLRQARPFPFFGAAGATDYNLDELARLDTVLMSTALPHRFNAFEGGHEWLPATLAERAVEWLQLQSMALGTVARDTAWISAAYARGLARAREVENTGALYDAWSGYHALVDDFLGLHDVSAAQTRGAALAQDRGFRAQRERRVAETLEYDEFRSVLELMLAELRASQAGNAERRLVGTLSLERLQRQENNTEQDRGAAQLATRKLNTAFALAAHEGDVFLRARRYRHAAAALRLALQARPGDGDVCWPLARALAQAHDRDAAFEALGCALAGHGASRADVEREPMLEPLRGDPRFAALLARPGEE